MPVGIPGDLLLMNRSISTLPSSHLRQRLKQTENEIVRMFRVPAATPPPARCRTSKTAAMSDSRPLDERFLRILKIFRWGPDAERALEVLMLRVDRRLVREVIGAAGVAVSAKTQFFRWAARRKGFVHDSSTFMPLIRCLDAAGLVGEMWKAMLEMVRSSPFPVAPPELSELVRILGRSKMVTKACSIFYLAKSRNCRPTAATYNAMIVMLVQENHHDKVHEIYTEMCSDGGGDGCSPDTATYDALISSACKLGRRDTAARLFEEMKERGLSPVPRIYTSLIGLCFRSGDAEEALRLFREMEDRRYSPNVFTYTELVRGLGIAGRVDDALHIYSEMRRRGGEPDTVLANTLVSVLAKSGRLDDAMAVWREMTGGSLRLAAPPSVVTYNTVIKALFDSGEVAAAAEAVALFERMKMKGVAPSEFTYSIMIDGFCKSNRVGKALAMLEEMDELRLPPCAAAYCSVIDALGRARRLDLAGELFREMRESCGAAGSRVYAVMIKHLGRCGRLGDARELFDEMLALGCAPGVYAYNALMSGMVRAGLVDEARTLLGEMPDRGCPPDLNSYNIVLNGVAKAGGPEPAVEMLEAICGVGGGIKPDAVSYNTVLGAYSRAGMFDAAAKLMKEMSSKGLEYDLITYSSILEAVGKVDEEDDAAPRSNRRRSG